MVNSEKVKLLLNSKLSCVLKMSSNFIADCLESRKILYCNNFFTLQFVSYNAKLFHILYHVYLDVFKSVYEPKPVTVIVLELINI